MGYRYDEFAPGEVYHVFTRGVEKRNIFLSDHDRFRFLDLLVYNMPRKEIPSYSTAKKLKHTIRRVDENEGLINLLCYCLMDNHVHLLLRENCEGGISRYMQRVLNGHAKYFNTKEDRSGSLFINPFKAVLVNGDEQLLHVARYIHINPYVAHVIDDPFSYRWSSLSEYTAPIRDKKCHTKLVRSLLTPAQHRKFVTDHADYARSLADIQHLLLDYED